MSYTSPDFWIALLQIIGVNIVLSGDNAVVIALAARGLPVEQQKRAVAWGSGAAVVMRIGLTIVAVRLLQLPYLKLVGAALLLWIAVQLLLPEKESEGHGGTVGSLSAAIRTILIADLVMSLDNVIAVAAAAKGNTTLLIAGLAISIPLVVFASRLLLTLMDRFPVIITFGAALLGWVAGEMAISDPLVKNWVDTHAAFLHYAAPAIGAALVILIGKLLAAKRAEPATATVVAATALPHAAAHIQRVLLGVDGSAGAEQAVRQAIALHEDLRASVALELHLANVQRPLTGDVASFVPSGSIEDYHRERSEAALQPARELLRATGLAFQEHHTVGEPGRGLADIARANNCQLIIMGARGLGSHTGGMPGSVASSTLEHASVPVMMVK